MSETYEEQLAKARARRLELEAAREKREAEAAKRRELEDEERGVRDEEAIAKAWEEHGEPGVNVEVVRTRFGAIIVKRAPGPLFNRFIDTNKGKTEDAKKLVYPCLVYPTKDRFDEIIETVPLALSDAANAISRLAGLRAEEVQGKS